MSAQTKFIVWDWNGTLLDDTDLVLTCVNDILKHVGHSSVNLDKLQATQTRPLEIFYQKLGLTEDQIPLAMDYERNLFHDAYEPLAEKAPLRAGAGAILDLAREGDLRSLILSNHIVDPICKQLDRLAIRSYFDEVLAYPTRATQYKDMTKGARLHHYMKDKNLNPKNAFIIGDTIEEIEIAREFGLTSVAITGGIHSEDRLRAEKPDYVIQSLSELKPILEQRGFLS